MFFIIGAVLISPCFAYASIDTWQKGVSLYPLNPSDFGTDQAKAAIDEIAADNANYITFVVPYYQRNRFASQIFPGADTPTDEALGSAIVYAHQKGLAVMIKPHVDSDDGSWRANIKPLYRDIWFANYENLLMHYVTIANAYGVEEICIGTELVSVAADNISTDNTARWEKIISDIRAKYAGLLTYSANWGPDSSDFADEKDHIAFWDKLDYIGVSAYFRLMTKDNSIASLSASWDAWYEADIKPLSQRFGKPVLFTEVGYRSSVAAHNEPYAYQNKGHYDPQEQVNAYEALFGYWNDKPEIAGVSLWDFYANPTAGGEGNTDYTPQNKPAEATMRQWFRPPVQPVAEQPFVSSSKQVVSYSFDQLGNFWHTIWQYPFSEKLIWVLLPSVQK